MHEAKTRLSQLVAAVEAGEVVKIARRGKPAVRLVIDEPEPEPGKVYRTGGAWKGLFTFDEKAWKEADAEILEMFEESINRPLDSGDR